MAEAKAWREDARVDIRRGVRHQPASPKLADVADEWLAMVRRGTVRNRSGREFKPGTVRNYAQVLRDYIKPELGDIRIAELTRAHVQNLVDELVDTDLSASAVRNALMPLRGICRRALIRGELVANPTHGLELPAVTGKRDRVASAAEAAALLSLLPVADRAIWGTAFYAGLRLGELRALQWLDVDFERRLIHVRHNWDRVEGLISPKSEAGLRVIPIDSRASRSCCRRGRPRLETTAWCSGARPRCRSVRRASSIVPIDCGQPGSRGRSTRTSADTPSRAS